MKNAPGVKVGMKESEVLDLLGAPSERSENQWGYNFGACVKPPRVGEQVITGLDIFFQEGVVRNIKWGWVDATGPGASPPRKSPKKKRRST